MSDHSLRHGRLLHASSSAGSVIGQVGGSPSVHTDINSAGTSLSSGGSETAWSAPDVPSPLVTPAEAFPFPHLQLHRPPLRPASSSNSTPLVLGASRHFFTPIHSGVRGLTRATPLLDLALCPAQTGDVTEKRHVAVMSRHSLKIMDMRPPKPTFAAAAANGAGLRRASSSPSVSATSATPQNATELIDVKAAGKLTKYGFTTLTWGYNVSADTVATGATDGTVMLWDVSSAKPQNANRLDRKRSQHDRSVNQVAFAGPSGVWLISAGQDGAVKLWVRLHCSYPFRLLKCLLSISRTLACGQTPLEAPPSSLSPPTPTRYAHWLSIPSALHPSSSISAACPKAALSLIGIFAPPAPTSPACQLISALGSASIGSSASHRTIPMAMTPFSHCWTRHQQMRLPGWPQAVWTPPSKSSPSPTASLQNPSQHFTPPLLSPESDGRPLEQPKSPSSLSVPIPTPSLQPPACPT